MFFAGTPWRGCVYFANAVVVALGGSIQATAVNAATQQYWE
jgi:hypothetical protein